MYTFLTLVALPKINLSYYTTHLYYLTFPIVHLSGCSVQSLSLENSSQKKGLRIVYKEPDKTLNHLLKIDGSPGIHLRNLRFLMIEVFKSLNKLNPQFMWNLFQVKNISITLLALPSKHSKSKGTNNILYKACWN